MQNEIYSAVILGIDEVSGENETLNLTLTEENNGLLVWHDSPDDLYVEKHFHKFQREAAIEYTVDRARKMREAHAKETAVVG